MKKNGFAPLIIIFIIAVLGFVGYFGYKSFFSKQQTANITSSYSLSKLLKDAQKTKDYYLSNSDAKSLGITKGFIEYKTTDKKYMSIPGAVYEIHYKNSTQVSDNDKQVDTWLKSQHFIQSLSLSYNFVRFYTEMQGKNTTYINNDLICQITDSNQYYNKSCDACAESATGSCDQYDQSCYYKTMVTCGYLTNSVNKDFLALYPLLSKDYSLMYKENVCDDFIFYIKNKDNNFMYGRSDCLSETFGGENWLAYNQNGTWVLILGQGGDEGEISCKNIFFKYNVPKEYQDHFLCAD